MTDPHARLTELEIALTHQERLAEDLSELVREATERLDRLERRLAELADRLPGAPTPDRRPPHW